MRDNPSESVPLFDPAEVVRQTGWSRWSRRCRSVELHARLAVESVPHEKAALQGRIEMTDRQIDGLVYELYALTPEEIEVVEGTGR